MIAALGAAGLAVIALLYRALAGVVLDEEGARVAGVPVTALNVTVAGLAGVTIGLSMRIVGILLIAALMVLPVIAASRVARSMRGTLLIAMGIGVASVVGGAHRRLLRRPRRGRDDRARRGRGVRRRLRGLSARVTRDLAQSVS